MKYFSLIILLLVYLAVPVVGQETSSELIEGEIEVPQAEESDEANAESIDEDESLEGSLDADIEALKKEVLSLNRDLFILEEDLLFPSNTQFSVFLSMNAGALFSLDSIQLKIDDKNIANHLYTERELAALKRGGVQRLYIGNLPTGEHEIILIFTGVGPKGRDYRLGETIVIEKTTDPQFVEFMIADDTGKEQPQFDVRVWE
ncbi:MAG: AraC family transcriptional regulator [Gammaproteobacteria bacterium]|nr:AraC family transcriptional regulator [Gammaproteobacteria bacterium]MDH3856534.1 AraC family transcriptional regulator [Gammaproteobacteria bacterium]